jgi:hypothetical protein
VGVVKNKWCFVEKIAFYILGNFFYDTLRVLAIFWTVGHFQRECRTLTQSVVKSSDISRQMKSVLIDQSDSVNVSNP